VPMFEVTVEGRGIILRVGDGDVVGFFRLVRVVAQDQGSAETQALTLVRSEWEASPNARLNRGSAPRLHVDGVATLPWWHRFLPARRGYIFFPGGGESNAV
jgi:hypothetical protein